MLTLRGAERGHGTVLADGPVPREGLAHAKRERGLEGTPREVAARQPLCADIDGFILHVAVRVVLKLKTPRRDGTTHLVVSPLEFMQRLAALMPLLRLPSPMTASRQPIAALRCPDWVGIASSPDREAVIEPASPPSLNPGQLFDI